VAFLTVSHFAFLAGGASNSWSLTWLSRTTIAEDLPLAFVVTFGGWPTFLFVGWGSVDVKVGGGGGGGGTLAAAVLHCVFAMGMDIGG